MTMKYPIVIQCYGQIHAEVYRKLNKKMTVKRFYNIASHTVTLDIEETLAATLTNYEPFETEESTKPVFTLTVREGTDDLDGMKVEWRQEEEGQEIVCGTVEGKPAFSFVWQGEDGGRLVCDNDYRTAFLTLCGNHRKATVDNAMMVVFALATSPHGTLLFHSSTVSHNGKAYMFLGKSGTGKSTHSRLWLQNIEGTSLVNDDNPVVRIHDDGMIRVYGSPWSGKTPCYRHVDYELGAIVGLSQAPENKIRRMKGIEAYALLAASVSGKRWDKSVADGLHRSLNQLATVAAVWHLDCLPDRDAALLCMTTTA